jgi:hypothetical protein
LRTVYEPIDPRSIAELVPASPTPTLPYPKQTYSLFNFAAATLAFFFVHLGAQKKASHPAGEHLTGVQCCCHATPTWGPSPMRKFAIRGVKGRTDAEKFRLNLVGRGVKGPSETRFFRSKDRKNCDAFFLFVEANRGNFFRAVAGIGDRSGSIGAANDIRASECVRACEVGPIAQRSEIDRAREQSSRASNEVRDRSERSKIERRS